MPENPFPPTPIVTGIEGATAEAKAVPPPTPSPAPAAAAPAPTFSETLLDRVKSAGMTLLALGCIWVVAVLALALLGGQEQANAIGFGTLITMVAAFFVRSFLPQPVQKARPQQAPPQPIDSTREVIETVVFVVVLVLLLKSFAAEAFVIPTGSMAQTLWGYQKVVKCPECEVSFPVNCSNEVDPQEGRSQEPVVSCVCPNCRLQINFRGNSGRQVADPGWSSGDRVLVAKFAYDLLPGDLQRLDVVVFKFPGEDGKFPQHSGPIRKNSPMNYIKRLIGLPGEHIAIWMGKIFVLAAGLGPIWGDYDAALNEPERLSQLWRLRYTHPSIEPSGRLSPEEAKNRAQLEELFKEGKFQIIRKRPPVLLAMMRPVYDNDHQAKDLSGDEYQRWVAQPKSTGWTSSDRKMFTHDGSPLAMNWLTYRHVLRQSNGDAPQQQLITDFMAYNTAELPSYSNWASDLILECTANVQAAQGTFALEVSKGPDRFQALFDMDNGRCTLRRLTDDKSTDLDSTATPIPGVGKYNVRFANVDDRLTLWVNEKLVFGDGVVYEPTPKGKLRPIKENDLEKPVSIGSKGARVTVSKLKLFRDTYYTQLPQGHPGPDENKRVDLTNPDTWDNFKFATESIYYVQPGHYFCLGDNSPYSADSRQWGLVPRRLMLGRALLVYYPFTRAGRIR